MEYLIHYGVKGMKWGVRKDRRSQERKYSKAVFEGDFDIAKGSSLYRATNNPNEVFRNRSYMTLVPRDADRYATMDTLGEPMPYVDIYRSKEKIRVAGYKTATKILSDTYNLNLEAPSKLYEVEDIIDKHKAHDKADVFMKSEKNYEPYKRALISKGYDAVLDIVDAGEYSTTPIILLDDKKIKKGRTIASNSDEWYNLVWS